MRKSWYHRKRNWLLIVGILVAMIIGLSSLGVDLYQSHAGILRLSWEGIPHEVAKTTRMVAEWLEILQI